MSADERVRKQLEANAIEIQRLKMQVASQNARREEPEEDDYVPPQHQPQQTQQRVYNEVTPDQIANYAADKAAQQVMKNMQNYSEVEENVKRRMQRTTEKYPALQEDNSKLTIMAREEYARISRENPTLDEATKYELSVETAAAAIGARPVNAPLDVNADYIMPASSNPALSRGKRSGKSRLTQNILLNAKIMGINIDPSTPDGKKNLEELEESTVRFNADADEQQYKYR